MFVSGATHEDAKIVLECVSALSARARRVSGDELAAFGKRLATLAIQLQHNGALAALTLLHRLAQVWGDMFIVYLGTNGA